MNSTAAHDGCLPVARQVWPSPITAQAVADLERFLAAAVDEDNQVLFAQVVASMTHTRGDSAA